MLDFRRFSFLVFKADINKRDHRCPFTPIKIQKLLRLPVEFVKTIVGIICFRIAFAYEFFTSSTISSIDSLNPQASWTFCV